IKTLFLALLSFCFSFVVFAQEEIVVYKTTLVTVDDWKLSAKFLPPKDDKPVVIFLHSLGSNMSDWRLLINEMASMGYGYMTLDFRGHGGSVYRIDGRVAVVDDFRRTGIDNQFNRMVNDVFSAIRYLNNKGIVTNRIILAGAGIGANIAIKSAAVEKDIKMIALFSPTLNASRDVLTVNPLKEYGKRPVFMATSVETPTIFREASILQAIAYLQVGPEYVTFVVALRKNSADLINNNSRESEDIRGKFIEWLKNPYKPEETIVEPEVEFELYDFEDSFWGEEFEDISNAVKTYDGNGLSLPFMPAKTP
ncbi:MAG TPA: alpha/beta hydrolase, partial [Elusimicrobiales bacterium]|nr:alpha/beta hydrolase [Elusimicrobiales bacterium]